jgi:hypothetical protein
VDVSLEDGVELQNRFFRGLELCYAATTNIVQDIIDGSTAVGRQTSSWDVAITQRILDMDADGSAHVLLTTVPTTDQPKGAPLGQTLTRQVSYLLMDPYGHIMDVAGLQPAATYQFPSEVVRQGQSWEGESQQSFPMMGQSVTVTNTYVFEAVEQMRGYDCVRIGIRSDENNFELTLPDGGQQLKVMSSAVGKLHFAPNEGIVVRLELKTHTLPRLAAMLYDTTTTYVQELVQVRQVSE